MARSSKSGGKHITPSEMWGLFLQYKDDVKKNPRYMAEQRKGTVVVHKTFDGELPDTIIEIPKERPLTLEGFENWVYTETKLAKSLEHYFVNSRNAYDNYIDVCARIKKFIRQDQIEGGMVGSYNPSITQRLNGLVEKTENKHEVSEIIIKHES